MKLTSIKKAGPVKTEPGFVHEHAHEKNIFSNSVWLSAGDKISKTFKILYDLEHNMKCFISAVNFHTPTSFYCDRW